MKHLRKFEEHVRRFMGHLYEYELFILIGRFLHRWQEDVTRERDFGTFKSFFFFITFVRTPLVRSHDRLEWIESCALHLHYVITRVFFTGQPICDFENSVGVEATLGCVE